MHIYIKQICTSILNRTHAEKKSDAPSGIRTSGLPRQPQGSDSNISYKGNIDHQTFAPMLLGLGITSELLKNKLELLILHYEGSESSLIHLD